MANGTGFMSNFLGGLAGSLEKQNDEDYKNKSKAQAEMDLEYRKIALQTQVKPYYEKLQQDREIAVEKSKSADKEAKAQEDTQNYMRSQAAADGRDADGNPISQTSSPLDRQITAATSSPAGQPTQTPQQPSSTTPVQAMPQPQAAAPIPQGSPDTSIQAGPQQPMSQVSQVSSPEQPHVQDQTNTNSTTPQVDNAVPASTPDFRDQVASKTGMTYTPDDKNRVLAASNPVNALTPSEYKQYALAKATNTGPKAADEALKDSNSYKMWNWYHNGVLPNGVEVDEAYKNFNDPLYDKTNSAFMHAGSKQTYQTWVKKADADEKKKDLDTQITTNDIKMRSDLFMLSTVGRSSEGAFTSTNQEMQKILDSPEAAQNSITNHVSAIEVQAIANGTRNLRSMYELKAVKQQVADLSNTAEGRLAIAQNTFAIESGNSESLKAMQAYKDANGHTLGAAAFAEKYQKENNVFDNKFVSAGIDPKHPDKWLNPEARSFDNWKAIKYDGTAVAGPNGTTIDKATGQVLPDSLHDNLVNIFKPTMVQNAQSAPQGNPAKESSGFMSKFGL